ncbi:MAG: hypothetical protein K5866_03970 [Treponema sp.]|nr:hypothetical protein [Treponema sp.]
MFDKIESISSLSSINNGKIQPVRRHSKKEIENLYNYNQEASEDRKAFQEYLKKYPNPDNLSFDELLKKAASGHPLTDKEIKENESGLIIDVGHKPKEDDGVILSISSK